MSRARNIASLLDSGGDVLASALDNAVGTTTDVHTFKVDSNSNLLWEHGGSLNVRDGNNSDAYDIVIMGSTDQSYSVDSNGNLICTF